MGRNNYEDTLKDGQSILECLERLNTMLKAIARETRNNVDQIRRNTESILKIRENLLRTNEALLQVNHHLDKAADIFRSVAEKHHSRLMPDVSVAFTDEQEDRLRKSMEEIERTRKLTRN